MIDFKGIIKPTLLVDESKARQNIAKMAARARGSNVIFRPHFKTHQSAEIGSWFKDEGVDKITVSSLTMAAFFAAHGWKDITVALPFNVREEKLAGELSESINLNLLVTSGINSAIAERVLKGDSGYFIEIDTGYGRSGISWNNHRDIDEILEKGARLKWEDDFKGFLTHAGNTYQARGEEGIKEVFDESNRRILTLKERYHTHAPVISVGDTPGCSVTDTFEGIDEIRPGNFVFYDLTQVEIGSCRKEDIAVALACPVISKRNINGDMVIYGGGVHLSKESLKTSSDKLTYGHVTMFTERGWETGGTASVRSLSQEHGVISDPDNYLASLSEGDIVAVLPVHSCMTADAMRSYLTLEGRTLGQFSGK